MNHNINKIFNYAALHGIYLRVKKPFNITMGFITLALIVFSVYLTSRYMIPKSLVPGEFSTGLADSGIVIRTIEAVGIIVPENEVFIRANPGGVIKKIINSPGSHINEGSVILQLDTEQTEKELMNAGDQLEVMKNNLSKNRLNAKSTKVDLEYNLELKKLRLTSLKSDLTDQEQLLEVGGISPARIEKTKQEIVIAEMEIENAQEKKDIQLNQLEAEEQGLLLQISMKEKEIEEKNESLMKMTVRAPSSGIVLNIYGKEGEKINSGELLAQISNMTSFKLNASVNEEFADAIKTGGEVTALLKDIELPGVIGRVLPIIENNQVNFEVFLSNSSHPKLIPNLKVNLNVTLARKDSVLRIPFGKSFNAQDKQYAWIVGENRAMRCEIITGLKGNDYIEIIKGLKSGDQVITSDVSSFQHLKEINIEN